jgi:hypothetical protein
VTKGATYSVAAERPEAVRAALQRIWRENLTLGISPEEKYRRLYLEAPDPATEVFVLRAREGAGGEEPIVGAMGVAARRWWAGGREAGAALFGDFAVDAPHRHLLPALQLARQAREQVREHYQVGYGFPNQKAVGVMLRAGFRELGKTSRYVRVLRHAAYAAKLGQRPGLPPALMRLVARPPVARAVGAAADLGRRALDLPRTLRAAWGYRLGWCDRPDGRFDALWEAARPEYAVVGVRSAAFLAWRYPGATIATLSRRGDGALAAYAVVEMEQATGAAHLRDLFGHHADLGPLVDLLLPTLRRRGAASLSVRLLGAPLVRDLLTRRGFVVRGEGRTVVVQPGVESGPGGQLANPDQWHLFDVDEDA